MSEPLSSPGAGQPGPPVDLEELWAAHRSLRTSFHITLGLLLVLSGSLSVYFIRELSNARRQTTELTQLVNDYERNFLPLMENFRTKLLDFAQVHPDFAPIYRKYFGTNTAPVNQSPARAQPLSNTAGPRLPPP
jgi:hypothetical protein